MFVTRIQTQNRGSIEESHKAYTMCTIQTHTDINTHVPEGLQVNESMPLRKHLIVSAWLNSRMLSMSNNPPANTHADVSHVDGYKAYMQVHL